MKYKDNELVVIDGQEYIYKSRHDHLFRLNKGNPNYKIAVNGCDVVRCYDPHDIMGGEAYSKEAEYASRTTICQTVDTVQHDEERLQWGYNWDTEVLGKRIRYS